MTSAGHISKFLLLPKSDHSEGEPVSDILISCQMTDIDNDLIQSTFQLSLFFLVFGGTMAQWSLRQEDVLVSSDIHLT